MDKYNYNYENNNHNIVYQNKLPIVSGLYTCQQERTQELNNRISNRNIPSGELEPSLDFRPVMTKYSHFPFVDQKKNSGENILKYPIYNQSDVFNMGNRKAPWSGFASNVNTESILRNQCFALQKCEQSEYIPSSNSDLYNTYIHGYENVQTHPLLFKQEEYENTEENILEKEHILFNNFTRQQLLNACASNNKK